MDTSDQSEHRLPHEEGYGSPTVEEEMASAEESAPVKDAGSEEPDTDGEASSQGASSVGDSREEGASGTPEEAPSTDAEIDEGTTEQVSPRESFSSESDEEGSGLPEQ